jgi:cytochrome c peroxidase
MLYGKQLSVNRNEACTGYFTSLKAIVHFYNTRDVLPRCQSHNVNEGTTCWPAPEATDNMKTGAWACRTQRRMRLSASCRR